LKAAAALSPIVGTPVWRPGNAGDLLAGSFPGTDPAKPGSEIARQALALDRKQALITVQQMKLDFDSYNDNNEFGATLGPLDVNFQKDLDEMSLPDEYNPDLDDEEDDDE
jgi:hypothetical protein